MAAFPTATREALASLEPSALPGVLADEGRVCEGAKFHSPNPLVLHEVDLGPRTALLCGTCRENLRVLAALLGHHGELPWPVRREFGNRLRELLIPKESDG